MNGAIHFNDEPNAGSEEVSDKSGERHLAAKGHAELASNSSLVSIAVRPPNRKRVSGPPSTRASF